MRSRRCTTSRGCAATRRRYAARAAALRSRGWDLPESASNFVFARPPAKPGVDAHELAGTIFERLKGRHIYVRYFRGPETGDRLRVTIGTSSDMEALTRALDEIEGEIAG